MLFQSVSQIFISDHNKKCKESNKLNYMTQTVYAAKHKTISLSKGHCCQEIKVSDC